MRRGRVTIYDIARAAGVAPSTVSRTFGRPGRVSEDTAAHVRATAEALDYTPNRVARGLSSGRTRNIAVVVPNISNPFFADFMRGVHQGASTRGYTVILVDTQENAATEERSVRNLLPQVDGVVLCAPRMATRKVDALVQDGAFVLINRTSRRTPSVRIDPGPGLEAAVDAFVELGHQSVLYVRGPRGSVSDTWRRRTLVRLCRDRNLSFADFDESYVEGSGGIDRVVDTILDRDLTAVVTHNDMIAIDLVGRLELRGLSVPGQVSIVGHDNIIFGALVHPSISTVAADTASVGMRAAEVLIEQIELPDMATSRIAPSVVVPTAFLRRESIGPARLRLTTPPAPPETTPTRVEAQRQ